ncbi:hypothetical protein Emed_007552 [Eimeria media]
MEGPFTSRLPNEAMSDLSLSSYSHKGNLSLEGQRRSRAYFEGPSRGWGGACLRVLALVSLLIVFFHTLEAESVVWKGKEGDALVEEPLLESPPPAFAETREAGQTWYSLRMNRAPRLLRVTATPDEKTKDGKQWFQVLFNFKPQILKLSPDAAS